MTADPRSLSEREKETLRLLLKGHDAKSIARDLGLSVHTVNERLRASRRKLGVSSSREAARLLSGFEQGKPKLLVDEEIGVARDGGDVNKDARRNGRHGVLHPRALTIGGTLIMSLIITAAMLAWAGGGAEPGPLPNWSAGRAAAQSGPRPVNIIRLEGDRLVWNGSENSEGSVREYLGLVKQMSPRPLTVLSYSPQTSGERVHRARLLIDGVIGCTPGDCLEIAGSRP
jgi:DNA-binding CsgD family transcriptional regulator